MFISTEYVDRIIPIAEQLENIGESFNDNVVGGTLLGSLPDQYKPLILGIQGSKQVNSAECVKNLLLYSRSEMSKKNPKFSKDPSMYFHKLNECSNPKQLLSVVFNRHVSQSKWRMASWLWSHRLFHIKYLLLAKFPKGNLAENLE